MKSSYINKNYSALLDHSTDALLVLGEALPELIFVNEITEDSYYVPFVSDPNYTKTYFGLSFLATMRSENYPKWTWDKKERIFVKTEKGVLTDKLRSKSCLAASKHRAITTIINSLSIVRNKTVTGVRFQEEIIYPAKRLQAQKFKDDNYQEDSLEQYPYVTQYADFANLSLKQAADDILFKSDLGDQTLINTELLRLKYFKKVRGASTPDQVDSITKEFLGDCFYTV